MSYLDRFKKWHRGPLCGICNKYISPGNVVYEIIKTIRTKKGITRKTSRNVICSKCASEYKVKKATFEKWH